jgi:hypothetical protein
MIKVNYLEEINLGLVLRPGANDVYVKRVQEWLNIKRFSDSSWRYVVDTDGVYGPITEKVVRLFQQSCGLNADGIVGPKTYVELTRPMINAFTRIPNINNIRPLIVAYSEQHLANHPVELYNANKGPWVRAYMDGIDGIDRPWCMGFVQTIMDQSFSTLGKNFTDVMPRTVGCDVLGDYGGKSKQLIPNAALRANPGLAKSGDAFLIAKGGDAYGWVHTGIVTEIEGNFLHTIEGNSNETGSPEGFEAVRRVRDFSVNKIDIYSIEQVAIAV